MRYFTRFVAYLWMLLILCSVKAFISNGNGRYFVRLKPNENGELFAQFPRSKSPTSSSNSSPRKSSQPTSQSHPASSLSSQAPKPISKPPNFAMKNIQGKSTIICREFKIDSPKTYDFLGSFRALSQLPNYPLPEIAFIGRSNVGKSSLINCLTNLNKKVVITSKTPGRTQGINLIKCSDRDGEICILSDLPGYGYAKISKELQFEISEFVNEYLMRRASLEIMCGPY